MRQIKVVYGQLSESEDRSYPERRRIERVQVTFIARAGAEASLAPTCHVRTVQSAILGVGGIGRAAAADPMNRSSIFLFRFGL